MDKIKDVAQRLGIITVEDMERYTALELIMMIANKMNEFKETLNDQNDKIHYLLNDGVLSEVEQTFNEWLQDGTFDTLINQSALKKVNDRIDETNVELSQRTNDGGCVFVEHYRGTLSDSELIEKAIDESLKNNIKEVYLSAKTYRLTSKIIVPSGVKLIGVGWERDSESGTRILRCGDFVAFECKQEQGHTQGIEFKNISFNDLELTYSEDFMKCTKCSMMVFENCQFRTMNSCMLSLHEVMDSRFINCCWEECMAQDKAAVYLGGGVNGLEYTNAINFIACRWEACRAISLQIAGNNVNEIYFSNCKMESTNSVRELLRIQNANTIVFDNLQICSSSENTLEQSVYIKDTIGVMGTLILEHVGQSSIQKFVEIDNPNGYHLHVHIQNGLDKLIDENAVKITNKYIDNNYFGGSWGGSTSHGKNIVNWENQYENIMIFNRFFLKTWKHSNATVKHTVENSDQSNFKYQVVINDGAKDVSCVECGINGMVWFPHGVGVGEQSLFYLAQIPQDPEGAYAGAVYFNTATQKFRGHNGSVWVDLN